MIDDSMWKLDGASNWRFIENNKPNVIKPLPKDARILVMLRARSFHPMGVYQKNR